MKNQRITGFFTTTSTSSTSATIASECDSLNNSNESEFEATASTSKTLPLPTATAENTQVNINLERNNNYEKLDSPFDLGTKLTGPKQPKMVFPLTKFAGQKRGFSSAWFTMFPWLEYSANHDAAFCFCCRIFLPQGGYSDDSFVTRGFHDWKNARDKLTRHATSQLHQRSNSSWVCYLQAKQKDSGSVVQQLSLEHRKQVYSNRKYLSKVIDILLYLSTQGQSIRGHDESVESNNRGNFRELCELVARNDEEMSVKLQKGMYLSKDIQNELLSLLAKQVVKVIVDDIRKVGFYTLLADESRDISKKEQISICVRYCNDALEVRESFWDLYTFTILIPKSIADVLINYLQSVGLDINVPIIAQGYDGANVMGGRISGVQTKIRAKHPTAMYIHCWAHKLNLVLEWWNGKWNDITAFCQLHNIDLHVPNKRKKVQTENAAFLYSSSVGQRPVDVDDQKVFLYHHFILPVIDCLINEMDHRFKDCAWEVAYGAQSILQLNDIHCIPFVSQYASTLNINIDLLRAEMLVAKNMLTSEEQCKAISTSRLFEVIKQQFFPNLFAAVRLALTFPTTTATNERSFSVMRRLKDYLRSTMQQQRFLDLAVLKIESALAKQVNINAIIDEFAECDDIKRSLLLKST